MRVDPTQPGARIRWLRVWVVSIAVWAFLGFYYAALSYKWRRDNGYPTSFVKLLILPAVEYSIAAVSTPAVYWFARRYPVEIGNWRKRFPLHIAGLVVYAFLHAAVRVLLYPPRNPAGETMARTLWTVWQLFLSYTYDDSTTVYVPILVIAQMIAYQQKYRDRELRAVQLERELVQAQLRSLKTQLQPHFLFNTMHSITALMHIDVHAADKMMTRLSDLLRLSLDTANVQQCSLKHELEFLGTYLEIEQMRFSDRLSISMQVDPETYDAEVPYMIMQPLAENAIRHGVSKLPSGGQVEVNARRENEVLWLSVRDNGPGFDFFSQREGTNIGTGLRNTLRRLKGLYGERFDFSVKRMAPGVEVCITLPFVLCDLKVLDNDPPFPGSHSPEG